MLAFFKKSLFLHRKLFNYIIMKKTLLALVMSVIMIGLASCGDGHSKAFNESKKILDNVKEGIEKAETCDDVDMATMGVLGLLGVEGVDAMPESEQDELSKITEEIDKVLETKKAELNCQDEIWEEEEEMPMEEPLEESEVME